MHSRAIAAITTAAAVAVAVFPLSAGASAPAAKAAPSAVNYVVEFTQFTGPGTIRFGGAIHAVGKIGGVKYTTVTLPGGTFDLSHSHVGKPTDTVNPTTCVEIYSASGTSVFSKGTGRYAGITGHATYLDHGVYHDAKVDGKCSFTVAPKTYDEFALGYGSVAP
jgi:hypothetical protein